MPRVSNELTTKHANLEASQSPSEDGPEVHFRGPLGSSRSQNKLHQSATRSDALGSACLGRKVQSVRCVRSWKSGNEWNFGEVDQSKLKKNLATCWHTTRKYNRQWILGKVRSCPWWDDPSGHARMPQKARHEVSFHNTRYPRPYCRNGENFISSQIEEQKVKQRGAEEGKNDIDQPPKRFVSNSTAKCNSFKQSQLGDRMDNWKRRIVFGISLKVSNTGRELITFSLKLVPLRVGVFPKSRSSSQKAHPVCSGLGTGK